MNKFIKGLIGLCAALLIGGGAMSMPGGEAEPESSAASYIEQSETSSWSIAESSWPASSFDLAGVPAFSGNSFVAINNNVPSFTDEELSIVSFEVYSQLDALGRCGPAYACLGQDLMPTEERDSISEVTPSGWHSVEYDGAYLYNRCHLIGYQLSAENANEQNLITGTRYLNVEGMLPFENMVADYIKETGNHVMYRVAPIFEGNSLVASGVHMEALSVEDQGEGIAFNVYCYNVQPGVVIDYATGESTLSPENSASASSEDTTAAASADPQAQAAPASQAEPVGQTYILNTNTHKFHYPSCSSVDQMNESNKQEYTGSRDSVIAQGYEPCKRCNP